MSCRSAQLILTVCTLYQIYNSQCYDTIRFDTVFTTLGSVTKQIRVYNNENKPLKIDQIRLGAGANSFYRLNVDGNTNIVVNFYKSAFGGFIALH